MTEKLSDTLRALSMNACFVEWEPPSIGELDALTLRAINLEAELARLRELVEKQREVVEAHDHLLDCKRAWLWSLQEKGLSVIEAGAEVVFCVVESKRAALEQSAEEEQS